MATDFEQQTNNTFNPPFGALPSKVDLRDYKVVPGDINVTSFELDDLPPVKNQGLVGSCVAHASSSILEWFNKKETGEHRELSTGFIYGMQGVEFDRMDTGMYLNQACKIIQKYGDCLAETIPYNIEMPHCCDRLKVDLNDAPAVYDEAAICKIESYARCQTEDAVKYAIMTYGPVLMSIKWDNLCWTDFSGVVHFNKLLGNGYHAVMVYGFDEQGWLCQNSWGKLWGNGGRFILPYEHGFRDAWSFVDAENSDIHKPKQNTVLDIVYRILNAIINAVWKR